VVSKLVKLVQSRNGPALTHCPALHAGRLPLGRSRHDHGESNGITDVGKHLTKRFLHHLLVQPDAMAAWLILLSHQHCGVLEDGRQGVRWRYYIRCHSLHSSGPRRFKLPQGEAQLPCLPERRATRRYSDAVAGHGVCACCSDAARRSCTTALGSTRLPMAVGWPAAKPTFPTRLTLPLRKANVWTANARSWGLIPTPTRSVRTYVGGRRCLEGKVRGKGGKRNA
jgi:hypothetical protein